MKIGRGSPAAMKSSDGGQLHEYMGLSEDSVSEGQKPVSIRVPIKSITKPVEEELPAK